MAKAEQLRLVGRNEEALTLAWAAGVYEVHHETKDDLHALFKMLK